MATKTDRIAIAYDLTFATPFHCGTGIREGLIDRTIVRDSGGYLYVPGSTFKGVVREHCEQIARLYEELDEMKELLASPHNSAAALLGLGRTISMVTRIFGSQNHPGQLFFDDAHQPKEEKQLYDSEDGTDKGRYKSLQTDLSTQVRLDRPTRTAVKGALYTSEFGVRDVLFKGTITGWLACSPISADANTPTYSLLLLLAGLKMVERLGGNKSTGKGRCTCSITHLTVGSDDYKKDQWQSWLERIDELAYYSLSQEGEA